MKGFQLSSRMKLQTSEHKGVTLTELLCVIAILAILAALYLPAISRAYLRIKKLLMGD
jgi:prepilin-type N-terminal cleavage/methylation domain-containing protein